MVTDTSAVETSVVIESRYGAEGLRDPDVFIDRAGIEIVEVDTEQARVARRAFSQFGKGRHPAGLNYGDGFSYALARVRGESLLFNGEDFLQTTSHRSLKSDRTVTTGNVLLIFR